MKNKFLKISTVLCFVGAVLFSSCETTELEILDNPNAPTPLQGDTDFYLNNVQTTLSAFFTGVSDDGMEVTRLSHMFGPTYANAYDPGEFNGIWSNAYAGILIDIQNLIPLATETERFTHIAIAQTIQSYVAMTLVDFYGDIPYSEALQGASNISPNLDSGSDVYDQVEILLDEAIANFNRDELVLPTNDLFYDGDEAKWIKFANTLKLKLYVQKRLVDNTVAAKINTIVNSGNFIQDSSEDFKFQYGTNVAAPDSRHPWFVANYGSGAGPSSGRYMSNWFANTLIRGEDTRDPRLRYYYVRQTADFNEASAQSKPCVTTSFPTHFSLDDPYCTVSPGYWGRDHGDAAGIPPDAGFRTSEGVYPQGGKFDDETFTNLASTDAPNFGLAGAGIHPIMMSSFPQFMLAESALELGTSGNAGDFLRAGMEKSIETVLNFGSPAVTDASFIPSATDVATYIDGVMANFDAANDDEKLNIIETQYFIALFGNGVEAYNTYRRTGKPSNLQPTLLANPGAYIRSFQYPFSSVINNNNINQKPVETQVFWDNNPAGFIN